MPPADSHCLKVKVQPLDGLCVLARLSSFQRTDGSAPVAPYPTSARTHRPGLAWKALPPVGRGTFRGTLRGYYRLFSLSTPKLQRRQNKSTAAELEGTPELGTAV
jgi:hypothetical protein